MREKNFLGFTSFQDFITTLIGIKTASINAIFAFIAVLTTFITNYIWDDSSAIYTLWALMFADWITGIVKASRSNNFVSYKVFRMPIYFLTTSFVISISWWLAKSSLLFYPLPGIVFGGFCSVYFFSLLENLGEIGLLPKALVNMLKKRFGLKALFDKFDKEEGKSNDEPSI